MVLTLQQQLPDWGYNKNIKVSIKHVSTDILSFSFPASITVSIKLCNRALSSVPVVIVVDR